MFEQEPIVGNSLAQISDCGQVCSFAQKKKFHDVNE